MTHLQAPSAVRRAPLPAFQPSHPFLALKGNRTSLTASLAARRAAVASLEAAWVAAAEADAARTNTQNVRIDDRSTWDRATWDRYLTAASAHEPDYKPRIKRLLGEIANIEKLLVSPCKAGHATPNLAVNGAAPVAPSSPHNCVVQD